MAWKYYTIVPSSRAKWTFGTGSSPSSFGLSPVCRRSVGRIKLVFARANLSIIREYVHTRCIFFCVMQANGTIVNCNVYCKHLFAYFILNISNLSFAPTNNQQPLGHHVDQKIRVYIIIIRRVSYIIPL